MDTDPPNSQSRIPHAFFAPANENPLLFDILLRANKLWDRMVEIDRIIIETKIPTLRITRAANKIKDVAQKLEALIIEFNNWNENATQFLWAPKITINTNNPTDNATGFIHYSVVLTHRIIQMNEKMGAVVNNARQKSAFIRHKKSERRAYVFFLVSILISLGFSLYNILK